MKLNEKPVYEHDCDGCKFLGTYDAQDLYFCKTPSEANLIARYGKHDYYSSGLVFGKDFPITDFDGSVNHLRIAWLIAVDMGLIKASDRDRVSLSPIEPKIAFGEGASPEPVI